MNYHVLSCCGCRTAANVNNGVIMKICTALFTLYTYSKYIVLYRCSDGMYRDSLIISKLVSKLCFCSLAF